MALLSTNYYSTSLKTQVNVEVYLPIDTTDPNTKEYVDKRPFRTLYLLHGMIGGSKDWLLRTNLLSYLTDTNIAVVMPYAQNSYYTDNEITKEYYQTFVGKELVEMTRMMFPLSHNREDTYIAGLSMGGFGAFKLGTTYHDTFSVIGSFSPAFLSEVVDVYDNNEKELLDLRYTDLIARQPKDFDVAYMVDNMKEPYPKVVLSCGTLDNLLVPTQNIYHKLKDKGIDVIYFDDEYDHTWDIWDISIQKFIDEIK